MAIMGFLVHALPGKSSDVELLLDGISEITTYGIHQDDYVVAVADAPHAAMEKLLERVMACEGVLTTYVTSLSMEDELMGDEEQDGRDAKGER